MNRSGEIFRVYLDVETYRPEKELAFTGEDIILIGLLEDEKEKLVFFKNFERKKEKEMLKKLYEYLIEKIKNYALEIVGWNILRYDIPLIISKSLKHEVIPSQHGVVKETLEGHPAEILSKFWHDIYVIDLQHVLLPLNNMRFKGLGLENAPEMLDKLNCEILSPCIEDGKKIGEWYKNGEHDKIKEKNKEDLRTTREIYQCIRTRLVQKLKS